MYITKYWGDFIGGSDDSLRNDNEDTKNRCIRVVATEEEYTGIKAALEDFVKDPKSYDLYEMISDDIIEMAEIVKELRKDLLQYEL